MFVFSGAERIAAPEYEHQHPDGAAARTRASHAGRHQGGQLQDQQAGAVVTLLSQGEATPSAVAVDDPSSTGQEDHRTRDSGEGNSTWMMVAVWIACGHGTGDESSHTNACILVSQDGIETCVSGWHRQSVCCSHSERRKTWMLRPCQSHVTCRFMLTGLVDRPSLCKCHSTRKRDGICCPGCNGKRQEE